MTSPASTARARSRTWPSCTPRFNRQAEQLRTPKGAFADIAREQFPDEFTQVLDDQSDQAIATGNIDVPTLLTGLETTEGGDLAYVGYRDQVAAALQDRADELNDTATSREQRLGILMVLTFGTAVALTVVVSLSITRPLRSLTRQAKDMAERRLPQAVAHILETPFGEDVQVPEVMPVDVKTRDEVGDVAAALNTVQDSALDLAIEQAVLRRNIADSFVNLGRRNQNLLGRQLDFITALETNEADPDTLSNLFRLDHLATRMRRNAESLLVLAGVDPPRRWAAPLRLSDVVRAAVGEVEDFHRVVLHVDGTVTVAGSAASDLAHLLAELIENALVFSPPDRSVEVHGTRRGGGYAIAVVDSGLGMPGSEIDAANRRLAGDGVVHHRPVQVPGPLRGRQPGRPPRRHGAAAQRPRLRHHRHRGDPRVAGHHRGPSVGWHNAPPLRTLGPAL